MTNNNNYNNSNVPLLVVVLRLLLPSPSEASTGGGGVLMLWCITWCAQATAVSTKEKWWIVILFTYSRELIDAATKAFCVEEHYKSPFLLTEKKSYPPKSAGLFRVLLLLKVQVKHIFRRQTVPRHTSFVNTTSHIIITQIRTLVSFLLCGRRVIFIISLCQLCGTANIHI